MIEYTEKKGSYIKQCPCSPGSVSCGYYNLNLHTGCPYSCSYCILQNYLADKHPIFFSNLYPIDREFMKICKSQKELRIGTGELSDSLAYDYKTQYSRKILAILKKFPRVVFEFKTKSINIQNLLNVKNVFKNIVISWSLNPKKIIAMEEIGTPSLSKRFNAISVIQEKGYKIGIHLDPIIFVKEWKTIYMELIKQLATILYPSNIAWISLGALRFPYSLRYSIFKHSNSRLFTGELIKGHDGKYRYFKPLRIELLKYLLKQIRMRISRETLIYICMEDREVWEEILPEIKPESEFVNRLLYQAVFQRK